MIRLPSIQEPYSAFFSGDDAIIQPPESPAEDADADALKAYKEAVEEYLTKIKSARKTGDWSAVAVSGKTPAKFTMRPMPFEGLAVVMGMREREEPSEDILLLAVQLCLVDIEGVNVKVQTEQHERFGKIAALSTFEKFGAALGLRIAVELGTIAIQRAYADPLA